MITSIVRASNSPVQDLYPGRVLISDFGLCRKLENDQSSFHNTTIHGGGGAGGGTIGWRAPECFSGMDLDEYAISNDESGSSSSGGWVGIGSGSGGRANRMTRAIDIFSAGCVFYYVLTNGDHPFGDRYSRERNILLNRPNLDGLDSMGQEGVEAKDLISKMISHDPAERPDAFEVMHHPYFWSANKRLMFMQDCSDRFEVEDRGNDGEIQSPLLAKLEHNAKDILVRDWYKVIDRTLVENLGKYRKYDGTSVRDLLRALRNKVQKKDFLLCEVDILPDFVFTKSCAFNFFVLFVETPLPRFTSACEASAGRPATRVPQLFYITVPEADAAPVLYRGRGSQA